ncbi:MAG: cupin domain-containing protein [Steroidobacteraceae bacterium]|jgi:quercetin dioxygenase-like cupin family protein
MKKETKVIIAAVAVCTVGGIAIATPILNLASPVLSLGTDNSSIDERGEFQTAGGAWFKVKLRTDGPSNIETQEAAYTAGGVNGWHSHPGIVAVTLTAGSIEWFNEKCEPTTYKAGDSWVEGSQVHYFRNTGTVNVQLTAVYVIAKGEKARIDQPAPACAAASGLD